MRLSKEICKDMYTILNKSRKVSKLTISEEELQDVCYTINAINGLEESCNIVGGYVVDNYIIPACFKDLIIPEKLTLVSGVYAQNFKSTDYNSNIMDGNDKGEGKCGKLLSPRDFGLLMQTILGAVKKISSDVSVLEARDRILISAVEPRLVANDKMSCSDEGHFVPILCDVQIYVNRAYPMDVKEVFLDWWADQLK